MKTDYTLSQFKEDKKNCEESIIKLINEFADKYGVVIDEVKIDYMKYTHPSPNREWDKCKLIVRL